MIETSGGVFTRFLTPTITNRRLSMITRTLFTVVVVVLVLESSATECNVVFASDIAGPTLS